MVKMRMRNEYMIDPRELLKAEITHPCAGVNQNIIIQEHRGGAQLPADSTTASKYSELHG